MTKDLNQLSKEIYEANKVKGFHDEEHSYEHMMCLVISELMEAVEADRRNRKADLKTFEELMSGVKDKHYDIMYAKCFKEFIKDTVEDELADAVIRLFDTAGALDLAMCTYSKDNYMIKNCFENRLFTESVLTIIRTLLNSPLSLNMVIPSVISYIETLCEVMEIDLWKHVELKLKYNSLRPYKHNKAY